MPFMDARLAETVASFSDSHLTGHPRGKAVLRKLAQSLLDPATIARPKIGFTVPVGDWFRGRLRPLVNDLLLSRESRVRGLLDTRTIDAVVAAHQQRRQDHSKLLWSLTNLEQFLRQAA
jgi:asparagine synthase (glutamine-hydrolysing)